MMDELKERIRTDGRDLGHGILKVDAFLNHQVDCGLVMRVGAYLAERFEERRPTKVLTAEISGITPAFAAALALDVPMVFARKKRPVTMPPAIYLAQAPSHTKGDMEDLMVSPEFLRPDDRVLIVDDFLASGGTAFALAQLVRISRAHLVGLAAVIEKIFEGGREDLEAFGVPIEAAVTIEAIEDGEIVFSGD